ncbi:hypothetical protein OF83DRAFT_572960 [Amylostereum chailletii]|nr:hypothetical protein OF83DRAFT_572960 [Amylostereum chailletii]
MKFSLGLRRPCTNPTSLAVRTKSLILNEEGVKLTYTDSGAPPQAVSGAPYTTVFAVHGMGFNASACFTLRMTHTSRSLRSTSVPPSPPLPRSPSTSRRVKTPVRPRPDRQPALRRPQPPSVRQVHPLLAARARGARGLGRGPGRVRRRARARARRVRGRVRAGVRPAAGAGGREGRGRGAAAVVGGAWRDARGARGSVEPPGGDEGAVRVAHARVDHVRSVCVSPSEIANHACVEADADADVARKEPPSSLLGTPVPPATWSPTRDPTIPAHLQIPLTASWITSYFDHGDLAARDRDALSHVVPSLLRTPSVYTMSPAEIAAAVDDDGCALDARVIAAAAPRALEVYRRVCFDAGARALVPRMRVRVVYGEKTVAFCVAGPWSIEEDDEARGGGFVESRRIPGVNHFMQWDEAELALKVVREAVDGV